MLLLNLAACAYQMVSKTDGHAHSAVAHHRLAGTASSVIIAAQLANQSARAAKCQHLGIRLFTAKSSTELANTHYLLLICRRLLGLLLIRTIRPGILLGCHN